MAQWPHRHLLQALEQYWDICSKRQLTLREFPEELTQLVARNSELQCYRNQLASILRVIRVVTNIYVFGPVTTGVSAYLVQNYFSDWLGPIEFAKQCATAVINDITEQLHRCDAALLNIGAKLSLLAVCEPSTPPDANAFNNTGTPVVCRARPCMRLPLSAHPRKAAPAYLRLTRRNLKRQLPSKRYRSKARLGIARSRHRCRTKHVSIRWSTLHSAHRRSVNARSLFPFNPGITSPWTSVKPLRADNDLGTPTLSCAGGPASRCSSGHADMATAIECMHRLIVSGATSPTNDATLLRCRPALEMPPASPCRMRLEDLRWCPAHARDACREVMNASSTADAS